MLERVRSVKYVLEIYVVVYVASCCRSVQYVFNVECNGMLNISIDNHIFVGMKQTVYVDMPVYISSYL